MIRDNEELITYIDGKCTEDDVSDFFLEFENQESISEFINIVHKFDRNNLIRIESPDSGRMLDYTSEFDLSPYFDDYSYYNVWIGIVDNNTIILNVYDQHWEDLIDEDEDIVYHYEDIKNMFIQKIEEVFSDE